MRLSGMRTFILFSVLSVWACSTTAVVKPKLSRAAEQATPPSTPDPAPPPPPQLAPVPPPAPPQLSPVSVSQFAAYSNLMPKVVGPGIAPSDSRITVWNLDVEGSEPVVVEEAVLLVQSDPPLTLRIEVDQPRVDPKGGKVSVQQRAKAYEGGRFAAGVDPCRDKPKTKLTLTVRIGSELKTLTVEGEYECVY